MSDDSLSPEDQMTPEELIVQMSVDELQELLGEMGFDATAEVAEWIQQLVKQLGSLEAAIDVLDEAGTQSRAA